jgi:hypothetical protein
MSICIRNLLITAVFAGILCFQNQAVSAPAGISVPLFRPVLGVELKDLPETGIEILRIIPNSPAALADFQPGDKVLSINGRRFRTVASAIENISSHPPYDTVEFVLERKGDRLTRKVVLGGRMRLEDVSVAKFYPIPGVDTSNEVNAPSATEALDRMNVLKRVLINPKEGSIEFIGTYDAGYATGPLPYRELLQDGLLYPEPTFTFGEPQAGVLEEADRLFALKEADIETFSGPQGTSNFAQWLRRWLNLIMAHPLLENERQVYLARHASAAGLTKREFALISNYTTLHGAMNPVPQDILELQLKILRNLGFKTEAAAYALYRENTYKSLAQAAREIGKFEQLQKILQPMVTARGWSDEMLDTVRAFLCCELMVALKQTSRSQADALWRDFEQHRIQVSVLDNSLQFKIVPEWDRSGQPLVYRAINRMPLSNELLRLFYGVKPLKIGLVFKDVPPTSHLARVLYKADYILKTVDAAEEIFGSVSGHKSFREIAGDSKFESNIKFRYELRPLEVPLFISNDRTEVGFGNARITIDSGAGQFPGRKEVGSDEAAAALKAATDYARQIPNRYDDYARAYPPLHELREAAKILALVKWLKRENIAVLETGTNRVAWTPPEEVPWQYNINMNFIFPPEGSGATKGEFFMPMSVTGGATFKIEKDWVSLGPKPPDYSPAYESLTTSAFLGEQAVQAALGGNLESARELAELSAQAMSGTLDKARLPANIVLPKDLTQRAVTPEEARLVKEAVKAIGIAAAEPATGRTPTQTADKTALLKDVSEALRSGTTDPVAATAFLKRLQTNSFARRVSDGSPMLEKETDGEGPAAQPFNCSDYLGSFTDGANLGDRQKEFLALRVSEIQKKLDIVRKSMEELSRLRQGDMATLKEREDEITAAYEEAQERALDAMSMLLIDGPQEILGKRREALKKAIDNDLTKTLLVKNVTLKAEEIARLDQKGFVLVRMQNGYTRIYDRTEGLQKTLSGAKSLSDMSGWADSEKSDYEKIKEGTLQIVEMMLADEKVGGALKLWKFTGASALRLLSLYKATDAAWEFFYDIMKQKFVWGPMVDELNKSLETNRRSVVALQEKSRDLQARLNCLRSAQ